MSVGQLRFAHSAAELKRWPWQEKLAEEWQGAMVVEDGEKDMGWIFLPPKNYREYIRI